MGETTELYSRYVSEGLGRLGRLLGGTGESRTIGCELVGDDGKRYLNCGGYGVFFVGGSHPRVVDAVTEQIRTRALATKVMVDPVLAEASRDLVTAAPHGMERVYLSPSGTDAVEVALKLALAAGHDMIITCENSFHGKTFGSLALTDNPKYRAPFASRLAATTRVPFGDIHALEHYLAQSGTRAAVFIEPIQSEGGVNLPPEHYLEFVSDLCQQYGAMLIVDEIMTGMGRCGHWWQSAAARMRPDVVLAGKGLSGGVIPVAATLATSEAFACLDADPYLHTSTFGGTPLQAAAVSAVLDVIRDEHLVDRSRAMGAYLLTQIQELATRYDCVTAVRGLGLLIGIETRTPGHAGQLLVEMLDRGVIINHSLNGSSVVRLTPPAILEMAHADQLLTALDEALAATLAQHSTS